MHLGNISTVPSESQTTERFSHAWLGLMMPVTALYKAGCICCGSYGDIGLADEDRWLHMLTKLRIPAKRGCLRLVKQARLIRKAGQIQIILKQINIIVSSNAGLQAALQLFILLLLSTEQTYLNPTVLLVSFFFFFFRKIVPPDWQETSSRQMNRV